MEFLNRIRDTVKNIEWSDWYKYIAGFFATIALIVGLLFWFHHRKISNYRSEIKNTNSLRTKTKNIVSSYKLLLQQKEKAEEILSKNKEFRIAETYLYLIQKAGLASRVTDKSPPTTGERFSDKTEVQISSSFTGLTMKQLVDFLVEIAQVPQLYMKDLTIKKNQMNQTIDVEMTVATLEPTTIE